MLSTLKSRDPDVEKSQGVAMWFNYWLPPFKRLLWTIEPPSSKLRSVLPFFSRACCSIPWSLGAWPLVSRPSRKDYENQCERRELAETTLCFNSWMPVWQTEFKHIQRNCTKFSERFLIATWSDLTKDFLKQCLQRRAAEEKWARIAHAKASLRWPILWINFCLSSFNLDPHRLRFRIFQVLFRTPQASLTAWLELCPTFRRRIAIETWSDWVGLQRGGTNDLLETLLGWV